MNKLLICILGSGKNANSTNIKLLLESIQKNIGIEDYQFYIYCNDEQIRQTYIDNIQNNKIYSIKLNYNSFAKQINDCIKECYGKFEYFLYTHDDLTINTENFIPLTLDVIKNKDKIGWVTYTNIGYTTHNKWVSNSVRCGLHSDRNKFPKVFECHLNTLDYPNAPIKVFGPYTHFNLIGFESFKIIGEIPEWTTNNILIDEDHHCLTTLISGFKNIWIPYITYTHPLNENERKENSLRDAGKAGRIFVNKWNLQKEDYTENDIKMLINKYSVLKEYTNNSFDYIYDF